MINFRNIPFPVLKMVQRTDVIFAEALDCYVELGYSTELCSIRFIKDIKEVPEKKTRKASFELERYFKGERTELSCGVDISYLSPFQQRVLSEARNIKYGETITYSGLAERVGSRAFRAVGNAMAINPIPIVIPCHRVVAKNGIGGYSAGLDIKIKLLELERMNLSNNL